MKFYATDNDLYKFTMQQAVLHNYPDAWVKYRFKIRNPHVLSQIDDLHRFFSDVHQKIHMFCKTRFTTSELLFLSSIPYMKSDYIDFLEDFTFKSRYINLIRHPEEGLSLSIEGPWVQTILFEVPLLYIISETYTEHVSSINNISEDSGIETLKRIMTPVSFSNIGVRVTDFGTRRRYSQSYQERVILQLKKTLRQCFLGTSNVYFAMKHNLKAFGTMAHEWLQAHQALFRVSDSQKMALEVWAHEYRGDLGIALSDVVGFDAFLRDFDPYFAKLFDGCRHDSGNPFEWCKKLIKHYQKMGIDPMTKSAIFSDGLNLISAMQIHDVFKSSIQTGFGIGTSLSNIKSIKPPQIVIKMVECNGKPVAKVSDSSGKGMCEDEEYLSYLKHVFKINK